MANGRTNAEDSGPEGAPESFFAWRGPKLATAQLEASAALSA